jgi:hypothetical protein
MIKRISQSTLRKIRDAASSLILVATTSRVAHPAELRFTGGVGKQAGSAENFRTLLHDVKTKLLDRLPTTRGSTRARQGQHAGSAKRPAIPEWHARGW